MKAYVMQIDGSYSMYVTEEINNGCVLFTLIFILSLKGDCARIRASSSMYVTFTNGGRGCLIDGSGMVSE